MLRDESLVPRPVERLERAARAARRPPTRRARRGCAAGSDRRGRRPSGRATVRVRLVRRGPSARPSWWRGTPRSRWSASHGFRRSSDAPYPAAVSMWLMPQPCTCVERGVGALLAHAAERGGTEDHPRRQVPGGAERSDRQLVDGRHDRSTVHPLPTRRPSRSRRGPGTADNPVAADGTIVGHGPRNRRQLPRRRGGGAARRRVRPLAGRLWRRASSSTAPTRASGRTGTPTPTRRSGSGATTSPGRGSSSTGAWCSTAAWPTSPPI